MKLFCKKCYEDGVRGGKSVFRRTPSMRPGWSEPEDYFILSQTHEKHEQMRTTLPAWMVDAAIAASLDAVAANDHLMEGIAIARAGARETSVIPATPRDDAIKTRDAVARQINAGVEELLGFRQFPAVMEQLRAKLKSLAVEHDQLNRTIEIMQPADQSEADHRRKLEMWERFKLTKVEKPEDYVDHILITDKSLEIHFNIELVICLELPKKVSKTDRKFKATILRSGFEYFESNRDFELNL